ncbi:MAG: FHA domain-containing protein [Hyphomonas sp.]|nr:FHA domain-containing protein [Hyphomonas sp.]
MIQSPTFLGPQPCCHRTALDPRATFCDECGQPILRCMASEECGALLDASGQCPVCVAPELSLNAGAAASVRVGGSLALPLVVANLSRVNRPLFIEAMWVRGEDGQKREVELPFHRLNPGASAEVGVRTGRLETAGMHRIDIMFVAATRFLWREERYVFTTSVAFPVEEEGPSEIVQNYNIHADEIGAGMTIYNPTRIQKEREAGIATHAEPIVLTLQRADTMEKELGQRGYEDGLSVPRSVAFEWVGFDDGQAPDPGPIRTHGGVVSIGRASPHDPGAQNDVRLLISGPDGVDQEASVYISRRHFFLYIENDRLMLRVESKNGLRLNGDMLAKGETARLKNGDVIAPLVRRPEAISVMITIEKLVDEAGRILVRRRVGTRGK